MGRLTHYCFRDRSLILLALFDVENLLFGVEFVKRYIWLCYHQSNMVYSFPLFFLKLLSFHHPSLPARDAVLISRSWKCRHIAIDAAGQGLAWPRMPARAPAFGLHGRRRQPPQLAKQLMSATPCHRYCQGIADCYVRRFRSYIGLHVYIPKPRGNFFCI